MFLQKQIFFDPRHHEIEKIPVKLAAAWITKHHYLSSFPSASVYYGIFRHGELAGVAVLGTIQKHDPECLRHSSLQRLSAASLFSLKIEATASGSGEIKGFTV